MPRNPNHSAKAVNVAGRRITLELSSGRRVQLPPDKFPRLAKATDAQLATVQLRRGGEALRWECLDEDIQVASVVAGLWPTHGGARAGAGRKPTGNVPATFRLTRTIRDHLRAGKAQGIPQATIIRDALKIRDSVLQGAVGDAAGITFEVSVGDMPSFRQLANQGITALQIRAVKSPKVPV